MHSYLLPAANGRPQGTTRLSRYQRQSFFASFASVIVIFTLGACTSVGIPHNPPLVSGTYIFSHRDAEFPDAPGFLVIVKILGDKFSVENPTPYGPIPAGIIDEGTLMWHEASHQWILGNSELDRYAEEVGGCSDGPSTIDFENRILWTCEGGP